MNDLRWQNSTDDELAVMLEALQDTQDTIGGSRTSTDRDIRRDLIAYIKLEQKARTVAA